jgi:RNA polymerase sigma-70 factor (ECF subfamily)
MQTVTQAWKDHRPYLVDLAFRMLGDIGAAEDAVQDAFSRLARADSAGIEDARGWLIVVTSRLCLDQIRSARMRREQAHDAMEIEFVSPGSGRLAGDPAGDPADRVTLDDNVRLALLVVLERLSPAERVVFVLHDIFQLPFGAIADILGRPAPSCRQLARRARQKIGDGHGGPRFSVGAAEHRQVTERFIAACTNGDLDGLLAVLDPSAWGTVDLGPDSPRTARVITGAHRVARNLIHFWGQGATLVSHPIAGQPAVLGFTGRRLAGVLVFTMRGELIQAVRVIADPRQLDFLNAQLASPG